MFVAMSGSFREERLPYDVGSRISHNVDYGTTVGIFDRMRGGNKIDVGFCVNVSNAELYANPSVVPSVVRPHDEIVANRRQT